MLASTLNRTLRSFALAIVGAEYVLRWLEPGTHRWEQFVTPLELTGFARAAGLRRVSLRGVVYDPFRRDWRLSSDTGVNYLFAATKPNFRFQSSIAPFGSGRFRANTGLCHSIGLKVRNPPRNAHWESFAMRTTTVR